MSNEVGPTYLPHQLFLIRHGETVDNVAGLYAGIRDSALTNHGVQQALRLGHYFANRNIVFTHIFSSDLKRANKTAESLRQSGSELLEVVQTQELREQDFGYLEGKHWHERIPGPPRSGNDVSPASRNNEASFQDVESKESMVKRADKFIDEKLLPILNTALPTDSFVIAIVSHGIILSNFWRCLLRRQSASTVLVDSGLLSSGRPLILEHLGGWSNTGFLELLYQRKNMKVCNVSLHEELASKHLERGCPRSRNSSPDRHDDHDDKDNIGINIVARSISIPKPLTDAMVKANDQTPSTVVPTTPAIFTISVKRINCKEHLQGLKRTGGGVGSSRFDEGQTTIESFFKRQKITET